MNVFLLRFSFAAFAVLQGFSRELHRLERFARAACAKDRRYHEAPRGPRHVELLGSGLASAKMNHEPIHLSLTTPSPTLNHHLPWHEATHWRQALHLWSAAAQRNEVVSYSSALSALEKGRSWTLALEVFQRMDHRQLQRDVIATGTQQQQWKVITAAVYNAAISACGERWRHALVLVKWLAAVASVVDCLMRLLGLQPNVITCSSLISACEKAGRWQEALHVLEELPSCQVRANVISYNAAIRSFEERWQRALQLAEELRSGGLSADVITVNSVINDLRGRRWDVALRTQRQWRQALKLHGPEPDVLTVNLTSLGGVLYGLSTVHRPCVEVYRVEEIRE
eukprot:Skav212340  [mRNA]  locus=scaffold1488:128703:136906:+ [translate_table: standard]